MAAQVDLAAVHATDTSDPAPLSVAEADKNLGLSASSRQQADVKLLRLFCK